MEKKNIASSDKKREPGFFGGDRTDRNEKGEKNTTFTSRVVENSDCREGLRKSPKRGEKKGSRTTKPLSICSEDNVKLLRLGRRMRRFRPARRRGEEKRRSETVDFGFGGERRKEGSTA